MRFWVALTVMKKSYHYCLPPGLAINNWWNDYGNVQRKNSKQIFRPIFYSDRDI